MKHFISKGAVLALALAVVWASLIPIQSYGMFQTEKKVNINTASLEELQTLPRIGEKVAQRIIDFRKANGKFQKITDLLKVQGIGEKIFDLIKDKITVGSPSPEK